jgi:ATP-binding cassette subfamily B protein
MIGTVVLFFLVIQKGFSVMKDFFQSIAGLINDNVYLNDFFDFLNLPQSQNIHKNKKKIVSIKDKITIDNVFFQYPSSQRNALNSVSMTIPKGKTVALVGANGSGKTTLVKLLCGFYSPDSGRILFDDVNIAEYNISDIRTQVTAVFQDFALYNLTAKENIYMGNIQKEISDFEIKQAAKDTGIDKVIENLPNGYENVLGNLFEKGEELSIGQWQKLAIAKAFYRDAPILIMDEPSSALDAQTELQILNNLKLLAKNKTTLIISHRFSTIQWVDLIYVLDEGKVVESGNHEFLMSLKGKYYSLFQASKFE